MAFNEQRAIGLYELSLPDFEMRGWKGLGLWLFRHKGKVYDLHPISDEFKLGGSVTSKRLLEISDNGYFLLD